MARFRDFSVDEIALLAVVILVLIIVILIAMRVGAILY